MGNVVEKFEPAKARASLTDTAYEQLEELIVTLEIPPGEVLSEAEVAASLAIGRTPIREALHRLSNEGLVRVLARRGYFVTEVNPQKQLLLLEVRRALELIVARSSAKRATTKQREQFKSIAGGMSEASDKADELAFMRLDHQLNHLLTVAARNEYASRALSLFHGLSRRFWFMHFREVGDLPLCAQLHSDQAKAISEGDELRSQRATNALIDYVEDFTRETVEPGL